MANLISGSSKTDGGASRRPNLILTGFMGTGKSTVGRILAERLGYALVDTDHLIEERSGKTIPEIFAAEGEEGFRSWEARAVREWLPEGGAVIACGGGLVTIPGRIEELRERGQLFCLTASAETVWERVREDTNRPLLQSPDPRRSLRELLEARRPFYEKAGTPIPTDGLSSEEVAEAVLGIFRKQR